MESLGNRVSDTGDLSPIWSPIDQIPITCPDQYLLEHMLSAQHPPPPAWNLTHWTTLICSSWAIKSICKWSPYIYWMQWRSMSLNYTRVGYGVVRALDSDCLQVRAPFCIIHSSQESRYSSMGGDYNFGRFRTPWVLELRWSIDFKCLFRQNNSTTISASSNQTQMLWKHALRAILFSHNSSNDNLITSIFITTIPWSNVSFDM